MASRARPDDGPSAIPFSTSVPCESPRSDGDGPIPGDVLRTLEPYLDPAEGTAPLELVAVLAGERPAAWLTRPSTLPADGLRDLLDTLPVHHRPSPGGSGPVVAAAPDRFDRLPGADVDREAFDRRMGRFLGYPADAIAGYERGDRTTRAGRVLVERGALDPSTFAHTRFVPWVRPLTGPNLRRQIAAGRRSIRRLLAVDARCDTGAIAALVATLYRRERRRLEDRRDDDVSLQAVLPAWLPTPNLGAIVSRFAGPDTGHP